ncbi:hypothetical protein ABB37_04457 [Leptomonas pyrrhocoris]|uniref:Uncharacterized protein n=1 Tax=Leptomonas pyrrhocoris TaxID=157538 RepID=A0A0N1J4W6_LEPPY|nr:hypothetical protein ABB37_04457 [Leptomonas pyrrhocoris]KPA81102.1 hypothetical protein ABB37_04457 [Leptomonas pyrrhocoris]|eukprot:XP_015659541.1 hypothetical protein ABB37_04457 [Leptomonas pyrrhocoris]
MLFRGPHDSGDVGAIGPRTDNEHSGDEDETCSTSGRSYTSAESATAQSFEMRMAQLDGNGNGSLGSGSFPGEDASNRKLLSPGYQLFPSGDNLYGNLHGEGEQGGGAGALLSGTRANDYPEEDERDDDYLAALLSDIERHAARLDTQFFRYPTAESLKQQQLATQAASTEGHGKGSPTAGGAKTSDVATTGEGVTKAESTEMAGAHNAGNEAAPTAATNASSTNHISNGAPGSSHNTGTKLFLGGLRYEVIQSGRHTVSWIFQVACGVHINPSSILIHRKTKNGRSNVAPTGCASVFMADDNDVATLLDMNQRIYCAEEGVYVSPSPDVMKELIASKDIVDVTGGRVRGPTHPVVIERAYSVSHHHGHHNSSNSAAAGANSSAGGTAATAKGAAAARGHGGNAAASGGAAGGAIAGTGGAGNSKSNAGNASGSGAHRHARTPSGASAESNLSNQLMGGMPPPYGGAMPPQYSASNVSSGVGTYQPPSYASSSGSSSSLGAPAIGLPMMGTSPSGFPPGTMMLSGQSSSSMSQILDDGRSSNAVGPLKLDPQRVTFHAYLRGNKTEEQSPKDGGVGGSSAEPSGAPTAVAHTVLFLAALPSDATEDYVSWLFSLMSIALPAARIHIIGGDTTSPTNGPGAATTMADCCATVSVPEGDVSIALNFHHRVLCTARGSWIGYSVQDIAALRASDPSLRDVAALHVDRRMLSKSGTGGGVNATSAAAAGGGCGGFGALYPHSLAMGGVGGRGGPSSTAGASMLPPPTSYPPMFGSMQLPAGMPAGPGGVLPMAAPWGFAPPHPTNMPPPPPPSGVMGGGVRRACLPAPCLFQRCCPPSRPTPCRLPRRPFRLRRA